MPAALFALQSASTPSFRFALYALVLAVGILVGLEIPLVMRILKRHAGADGSGRGGLKTLVSQVLTFDYLGALAVSIAFPLLLRAAARPDPHRRLLRPDERRRRGLGALALSRRAARPGGAGDGLRADDRRAGRRLRLRRPRDDLGRGPLLRRPRDLQRDQRLPARRRHRQPRRRAPLPQRQPAVPLARRVPLSRGAGSSGALGARRAAPGAGARRRRRHGGARDPQAPERRAGHAGRARSAHDRAVLDGAAAARPERRLAAFAQGADRQRRCLQLARAARRDVRRDRRRLPRPDQFLDRQALHAAPSTSWSSSTWRRAATPSCRRPRR